MLNSFNLDDLISVKCFLDVENCTCDGTTEARSFVNRCARHLTKRQRS